MLSNGATSVDGVTFVIVFWLLLSLVEVNAVMLRFLSEPRHQPRERRTRDDRRGIDRDDPASCRRGGSQRQSGDPHPLFGRHRRGAFLGASPLVHSRGLQHLGL